MNLSSGIGTILSGFFASLTRIEMRDGIPTDSWNGDRFVKITGSSLHSTTIVFTIPFTHNLTQATVKLKSLIEHPSIALEHNSSLLQDGY